MLRLEERPHMNSFSSGGGSSEGGSLSPSAIDGLWRDVWPGFARCNNSSNGGVTARVRGVERKHAFTLTAPVTDSAGDDEGVRGDSNRALFDAHDKLTVPDSAHETSEVRTLGSASVAFSTRSVTRKATARFDALVALDDASGDAVDSDGVSAQFEIYADGILAWRSRSIRYARKLMAVSIDVSNAAVLLFRLRVVRATEGNATTRALNASTITGVIYDAHVRSHELSGTLVSIRSKHSPPPVTDSVDVPDGRCGRVTAIVHVTSDAAPPPADSPSSDRTGNVRIRTTANGSTCDARRYAIGCFVQVACFDAERGVVLTHTAPLADVQRLTEVLSVPLPPASSAAALAGATAPEEEEDLTRALSIALSTSTTLVARRAVLSLVAARARVPPVAEGEASEATSLMAQRDAIALARAVSAGDSLGLCAGMPKAVLSAKTTPCGNLSVKTTPSSPNGNLSTTPSGLVSTVASSAAAGSSGGRIVRRHWDRADGSERDGPSAAGVNTSAGHGVGKHPSGSAADALLKNFFTFSWWGDVSGAGDESSDAVDALASVLHATAASSSAAHARALTADSDDDIDGGGDADGGLGEVGWAAENFDAFSAFAHGLSSSSPSAHAPAATGEIRLANVRSLLRDLLKGAGGDGFASALVAEALSHVGAATRAAPFPLSRNFESTHPLPIEGAFSGSLSIPGALALLLRFDRRCSLDLAHGDILTLSSTRDASQAETVLRFTGSVVDCSALSPPRDAAARDATAYKLFSKTEKAYLIDNPDPDAELKKRWKQLDESGGQAVWKKLAASAQHKDAAGDDREVGGVLCATPATLVRIGEATDTGAPVFALPSRALLWKGDTVWWHFSLGCGPRAVQPSIGDESGFEFGDSGVPSCRRGRGGELNSDNDDGSSNDDDDDPADALRGIFTDMDDDDAFVFNLTANETKAAETSRDDPAAVANKCLILAASSRPRWGVLLHAEPVTGTWLSDGDALAGTSGPYGVGSLPWALWLLEFLATQPARLVPPGTLHSPRVVRAVVELSVGCVTRGIRERASTLVSALLSAPLSAYGPPSAALGAEMLKSLFGFEDLENTVTTSLNTIFKTVSEAQTVDALYAAATDLHVPEQLRDLTEFVLSRRTASLGFSYLVDADSEGWRSVRATALRDAVDTLFSTKAQLPKISFVPKTSAAALCVLENPTDRLAFVWAISSVLHSGARPTEAIIAATWCEASALVPYVGASGGGPPLAAAIGITQTANLFALGYARSVSVIFDPRCALPPGLELFVKVRDSRSRDFTTFSIPGGSRTWPVEALCFHGLEHIDFTLRVADGASEVTVQSRAIHGGYWGWAATCIPTVPKEKDNFDVSSLGSPVKNEISKSRDAVEEFFAAATAGGLSKWRAVDAALVDLAVHICATKVRSKTGSGAPAVAPQATANDDYTAAATAATAPVSATPTAAPATANTPSASTPAVALTSPDEILRSLDTERAATGAARVYRTSILSSTIATTAAASGVAPTGTNGDGSSSSAHDSSVRANATAPTTTVASAPTLSIPPSIAPPSDPSPPPWTAFIASPPVAAGGAFTPLTLPASFIGFVPSAPGAVIAALADVPTPILRARFSLLRAFNAAVLPLLNALPLFSPLPPALNVGARVRELVGTALFPELADQHLQTALAATVHTEWGPLSSSRNPLKLDNPLAKSSEDLGETSIETSNSFFKQAFTQLRNYPPRFLRSTVNEKGQVFVVAFAGEASIDQGGPYREAMHRILGNLFSTKLALLAPVRAAGGGGGALFAPNPALAASPLASSWLEVAGRLLGMSLRTRADFPFAFATPVWRALVGQRPVLLADGAPRALTDLNALNANFAALVERVRAAPLDAADFAAEFPDLTWTFPSLAPGGASVDIIPQGAATLVDVASRMRWAEAAEMAALREIAPGVDALRRGLCTVVPLRPLLLLRGEALERLVCGEPRVDVALFKEHTRYSGGFSSRSEAVLRFWRVFEDFSDDERANYVRFAWGRSRLPGPGVDWSDKHTLDKMDVDGGSPDSYFPVAHTCYFSVELPAYTSDANMRAKLLSAIEQALHRDGLAFGIQ